VRNRKTTLKALDKRQIKLNSVNFMVSRLIHNAYVHILWNYEFLK